MGGILDASIISLNTIESAKSAEVVGNSRIELILYKPRTNHTRLQATKINLGTLLSKSRLAKVFSTLNKPLIGVMMALLVTDIEKILSVFPDMYIMNAFIPICFPGFMARAMALALCLASSCAETCELAVVEGAAVLRSAACRFEYPIVGGHFDNV